MAVTPAPKQTRIDAIVQIRKAPLVVSRGLQQTLTKEVFAFDEHAEFVRVRLLAGDGRTVDIPKSAVYIVRGDVQ